MSVMSMKKEVTLSFMAYLDHKKGFLTNLDEYYVDENNVQKLLKLYDDFKSLSVSYISMSEKDYKIDAGFYINYYSCITEVIETFEHRELEFSSGVIICDLVDKSESIYSFVEKIWDKYIESEKVSNTIKELLNDRRAELYLKGLDYSIFVIEYKRIERILIQKIVMLLQCVCPYRYDDYVELLNKGIQLGSMTCKDLMIYNCVQQDNPDLVKARKLYDEIASTDLNIKDGNINQFSSMLTAKISSYHNMFVGYYDNRHYKEAKDISLSFRSFIQNLEIPFNINGVTLEGLIGVVDNNLNKISNKLNEKLNNKFNELLIKKYIKNENIIEIMPEDVKLFMITSLNIYNFVLGSSDVYDYSSVVMPLVKGVELLLHRIFGIYYLEYLHRINNLDFMKIDKVFKIYHRGDGNYSLVESVDYVEFGSALHLLAFYNSQTDRYFPNEYFLSFCNDNNVNDAENKIIEIANVLNKVRKIRNIAAHKNRVYESDAKECEEYVLTNFKLVECLLDTFSFCFINKIEE